MGYVLESFSEFKLHTQIKLLPALIAIWYFVVGGCGTLHH